MSGETLALETQLLLQEVTQAKQYEVVAVEASEGPAVSEVEAAKLALVAKLRKKKVANQAYQQQLYEKRYGFSSAHKPQATTPESKQPLSVVAASRLTPVKAPKRLNKLPVAASVAGNAAAKHKKDLLSKLRTQAVKQGAQEMAKLFGYSSYEEQIKHLNKLEKAKILQNESMAKQAEKPTDVIDVGADKEDEDSSSDFAPAENDEDHEEEEEEGDGGDDADHGMDIEMETADDVVSAEKPVEVIETTPSDVIISRHSGEVHEETQALDTTDSVGVSPLTLPPSEPSATKSSSPTVARRRRNRVAIDDGDENDGNEADSEEDGKSEPESGDEIGGKQAKALEKKDKAAAFRQLLAAEAMQNRKHKRLRNGANFVESEAEEDEEEDVLKIGGLGDFGFGVPQAATKESKEAEDERNALKLREDDLEGIVDDLSDEERDQQQDLEEIFRRELEEQDKQQVKEVMRNVKEGFGRNRRAFSSLNGGLSARGRFNLDELVAADGDKLEAARLGLLESDEDMDDDEHEEGGKKGEEAEEEDDEEAEMERKLRERFLNQPKIYITSSESESEGEAEAENNDDEAVKEEIQSDEERERQQMKQFSERARINRRMQRMKDLQRQIAKDAEIVRSEPRVPHASLLLDDEDDESQSLMKVLKRTDAPKAPNARVAAPKDAKTVQHPKNAAGPKIGRFNSFGMGGSIRSTSSFSRAVDNCKLFNAGSSTSTAKGFVFTSAFGSDKQTDGNAAPEDADVAVASTPSKSKAQTTSSRPGKRPFAAVNGVGSASSRDSDKKRKSSFFSALSSYQCVSQSDPM